PSERGGGTPDVDGLRRAGVRVQARADPRGRLRAATRRGSGPSSMSAAPTGSSHARSTTSSRSSGRTTWSRPAGSRARSSAARSPRLRSPRAEALRVAAEKAERREGLEEAGRFYARALELVGGEHPA